MQRITLCGFALLLVAMVQALPMVEPEGWINNAKLQNQALGRSPMPVKKATVNLDLPPIERWAEVGAAHQEAAQILVDYIHGLIPSWAMPLLEDIALHIDNYRGFGEFADEMKGYAKALNVNLADIVIGSLIYELEHLGINCTARNTTGPCPSKVAETANADGIVYPFRRPEMGNPATGPMGMCTSVVAQTPDGHIWHGRNMDWNLPLNLRSLYVDVEFTKANKTLYVGTSLIGYVGVFSGMRPNGFSFSMDARDCGGDIIPNLLEMLFAGAALPTQHARKVLEDGADYDHGIELFTSGKLANPVYYIVGGVSAGQGAVISRDRNDGGDVWRLNATETNGWYRLETNYDHWKPVPSYDDRRTPGYKNMEALGSAGVNGDSLLTVMKTWPTFNPHTDYTGIFSAGTNVYQSAYWSD